MKSKLIVGLLAVVILAIAATLGIIAGCEAQRPPVAGYFDDSPSHTTAVREKDVSRSDQSDVGAFNNSTVPTDHAGTISGGVTNLSGKNTYAGGTSVSAGTANISGPGSLAVPQPTGVPGSLAGLNGASNVSNNATTSGSLGNGSGTAPYDLAVVPTRAATQPNGSYSGVIGGTSGTALNATSSSITGSGGITVVSPTTAPAATLFNGTAATWATTSGKVEHDDADAPANRQFAEALPPGGEELWVIQRMPQDAQPPAPNDQSPGTGSMLATVPDETTQVPVPLKHTDVKAAITGYIASVEVTQQFQNPFNQKIEAVYVFPLPQNAAVNEFVMTIGDRHIRGIIREREEAKQIYEAAKAQGYVASLLTQERPNIFTQSVANIEPGKAIDIDIKYMHTLEYVDGWYEFVFPMVVGPRFNPPGSATGVGAVARGNNGASGQQTEVQYLRPDERSGHDISLALSIDAGVPIEQIECKTHKVVALPVGENQRSIRLADNDSIPNKDFVLRYKVAGGQVKSSLMTHRDKTGGYFTMMVFPPSDLTGLAHKPLEMVFTIDVSGSQSGAPLAQEKAATSYALTHMGPEDTFQVVRFGNTAKRLYPQPMPADQQHVSEALAYVNSLDATEGTMLVDGIHASLNFPHDENRLRFVCFMTDGFIGNEAEALSEIHKCLGPSRIFTMGVGSSTNRYLLDHMAKMGHGAAAYLGLNDDANKVMETFYDHISHPAMTNLSVDWGTMKVAEVYPRELPDLFVGRPIILTGRFTGTGKTEVHIKGRVGDQIRDIVIPVDLDDFHTDHAGIPAVWARAKIADFGDRATYEYNNEWPDQIKQVALDYNLMSPYTSFVAVDSLTRTAAGSATTVAVPVPEGVRYETTVDTARGN